MHLNAFAISNLLITLTSLPLAVIVLINGKTKLSKMFAVFGFSIGLWGLGAFFATTNNDAKVSLFLWRLAYCGVLLIPIFFLHAVYLLTANLNRNLLLFSYLQGIFFLFLNLIGSIFNDLKFMFDSFYYAQGGVLYFVSFIMWIFLTFIAHNLLIKFYIKNKEKQYMLLLFSVICGFSGGVMNFLPGFNINIYPFGNFLIPFYVVIMAYTISKYQILDVRIVVQRGLVYSILVTIISMAYLIFVLLTEKLFQGMMGYQSFLISTIYALGIAIFFTPVKNKIQRLADKIFFHKDPIQIAQENELLKQELERSERLKAVAALASGMAHEIKNPLTALKTFAEYLPQKTNDPEFAQKFSKIVSHEVGRIDNLVHQLLEFARPSPLKIEEVDIHKLLDDILEFLSNDLIKHNIKVIKEYNADIRGLMFEGQANNADGRGLGIRDNQPEISENPRQEVKSSLLIKADSNKLKQAFLNLFLNAIEAMPSGGTLTITTSIRENPRGEKSLSVRQAGAEIRIQDTGCGIAEKDLPHIFEPFHSTKEKGTGLGLSISYGIIKEHQGKIRVESKLKEGTTFIMELPIKK